MTEAAEREPLACPACGGPLAATTGRCPSCGVRLLIGVPAPRAGLFAGAGALVGLVAGALVMGIVLGATRPSATAPGAAGATGALPGGTTAEPSGRRTAPPLAGSALVQAAVINGRLLEPLAQLRTAADASPTDAAAIAQALRALAADALVGAQLAPQVSRWPEAVPVSLQLTAFYDRILAVARDGLGAALSNRTAYRRTATRMVAVFDSLPAIDAAIRKLADESGLALPGGALPGATEAAPAGTFEAIPP